VKESLADKRNSQTRGFLLLAEFKLGTGIGH
jgi:hypothetical protein